MLGRKEIATNCRRMAGRIVKQFHPDRIILFGAFARGEDGSDSDADLLVAAPVDGSKPEKTTEIGVSQHDIRVPKDIVVTTQEAFEWRKEIVGTIERPEATEKTTLCAK